MKFFYTLVLASFIMSLLLPVVLNAQIEGLYSTSDLIAVNSRFRDNVLHLYADDGYALDAKVLDVWRSDPVDSAFYFGRIEDITQYVLRKANDELLLKMLARKSRKQSQVTPLSSEQIQLLRDYRILLFMLFMEVLEGDYPYRLAYVEL